MLPLITQVAGMVLGEALKNTPFLTKHSGADVQTVSKVVQAVETLVHQKPDVFSQAAQELQNARNFAQATLAQHVVVDVVRGLVRPVITYVAMAWYVYARWNSISLTAEDYAIIGGILAFWFGFRPFEKVRNKL